MHWRDSPRPILVTGSHRSGTTWTGSMLAAAPGITYLHEPLSPRHRLGVFGAEVTKWFVYVTTENSAQFDHALGRMLQFRYNHRMEWRTIRSARDVGRWARDSARFRWARMQGHRPLLKDPHAILSTPWLVEQWGAVPVILVRHPAGFASSLKRLNWVHPFEDFLHQTSAMRGPLSSFRDDIAQAAATELDIVDQACLLWRIIHSEIARFRETHPEWIILRHEDLSRSPLEGFRELYSRLGLEWTARAEATIRRHSSRDNPTEAPVGGHSLLRASAANVDSWRSRLSAEEAERVQEATRDIAGHFYGVDEW